MTKPDDTSSSFVTSPYDSFSDPDSASEIPIFGRQFSLNVQPFENSPNPPMCRWRNAVVVWDDRIWPCPGAEALGKSVTIEAEAPKCVEVTLFRQGDRQRDLISLINFQKELPNVPVYGVKVRGRLGNRDVRRVVLLPGEQDQPFKTVGDYVEFGVPRLETFRMPAVDYQ
jgi:hypothetical protein